MSYNSNSNLRYTDRETLRNLPAWRKLKIMAELIAKEKSAMVDDLKSRYPRASQAEFRWLLLNRLHGQEIAISLLGTLNEARD